MQLPRHGLSKSALFAFLVLLLGAGGLATAPVARSGEAGQEVSVIDGDTIQLGDRIVQLFGVDAPELGQLCLHDGVASHCGMVAAFELGKLLSLQTEPLRCKPLDAVDSGGAFVCMAGRRDVAQVLLRSGFVLAAPDANPDYVEAQDSAKEAKYGLWHSRFVAPQAWRAGERLPEEAAAARLCPVKGIAGVGGTGLYFVPTDETYDSLRLDPARGDRRFCSDEEARQAGWRRPGEAAAAMPAMPAG